MQRPRRKCLSAKFCRKKVRVEIINSNTLVELFKVLRLVLSSCINLLILFPYTVGLIFHESEAQAVLCKPKLLPLKSFTLEKLEKMQKEATAKAQETILDKQRELETQFYPGTNSGKNKNREYQNISIYHNQLRLSELC